MGIVLAFALTRRDLRAKIEYYSRTFIIIWAKDVLLSERKDMARRLMVMLLIILLASFASTVAMPFGRAEATTMKIYVDPPKIENEALIPNTTFNITVNVDDIPAPPGGVGVEFKLTFNVSVLKALSMQEVIFHEIMPPEEVEGNLWKLKHVLDNTNGLVHYAYTFQDNKLAISKGYAPFNGSHIIARITMNVTGIGKTDLHFTVAKIGDPDAIVIPATIVDGFFSNLPTPPAPKAALLYVDPLKIINSSLTPGNNFTINVNIINASGLAGLEFKLGFNVSALQANSVERGSFIPGSVVPIVLIDNALGFVKFNVSLSAPLAGDGTVAVIELHVEADKVKNSPLHLYDVVLVDDSAQPLPFTTLDGSFTNIRVIAGDLDQNGTVEIQDAIIAANSFGTFLGDADFNPAADLKEDNEIDIRDLILLANNFGKSA